MIACKLVHDTGTMVRFRTSQLSQLPITSRDVSLLLPNGRVVSVHFNRHPQNPNISGAELVRFIKRRLPPKGREDVLLERRRENLWIVHELAATLQIAEDAHIPKNRVRDGALNSADFAALVKIADREADRGRRIRQYRRVLRPSGLRRLVLNIVGTNCMVADCDSCDQFSSAWWPDSGAAIVEVHHIEEVARTIDHSPRNLCVLCANHHRFLHSVPSWSVSHCATDVVMQHGGKALRVVRPPDLFGE